MKRNPLFRFIPFRLALLVAPLLAAWPHQSRAANQEFTGASGATWHTLTNWTSGTGFPGDATAAVAGEGLTTDIMSAAVANAATNIGINMNTLGGQLSLGAIEFNKTNTATCTIGNNSTTTSGILRLNGATVNAVANTILRCNNEGSLTISNVNTGTAAVTMGLRLGTANGIISVGQNGAATPALRTLTINSIISEATAGNGFTKTGTGVLTLTAANGTSGLITVNDGSMRLQNATAAGTSPILLTNSDGAAVNNNDVLITGGLTCTNNITIENTTNQNARTRLQSTSTVNANANTWAGNITFKGPGQNQTIIADTAPLIIGGNFLQDGTTPTPSIFIRGVNTGTMNGNILLGPAGSLFKTDAGTWTISSTGNTMGSVLVADGLLILNNNDALEPDSAVQLGQGSATTGRMQINAGFTQQLTGISTPTGSTSPSGHTIFGPGTIDFGATTRTITVVDNTATGTELTITAPIIGSGGFTKAGTGNLIINGTVAGPVTVDAGGLAGLGGIGSLNAGVTVNAGGILGAAGPVTYGTLTCAGINLSAGSNLAVNLGSAGNDFLANTGALTAPGVTTINVVPNGSFTAGQDIPVVGYTGASPGIAPFSIVAALGSLGSRATASVVDLGASIGIHINAADKIIWTGGTSAWDIATTSNWRLQSDNVTPTAFQQYDALVFDDSGANTNPIAITGATTPVRAEFTNTTSVPYAITGPGSMGGTMVLDKTGNGLLTISMANSYTGATNITAGTLIANFNPGVAATAHVATIPAASPVNVGAAGTFRAIANDSVLANTLTVGSAISGSGTVEVNPHATAAGVIAVNAVLTGDNSAFSGTLKLLAPLSGTWRINNPSQANLGTSAIAVESGAQLFLTARTIANNIAISGTGFADTNGLIGALRIDNSTYNGNVTVAPGGARIGAHSSTGLINGNISGGPLEVNATNYPNNYTIRFAGTNTYTTTVIGGQNTQGTVVSMRLNIGDGGPAGTLGSGAVTINGDGANGVLGFDRSDGYTLGAGNTITGATGAGTIANSIQRTFIDVDCLGTGFSDGGVSITLGTGALGGNIRVAQGRANAAANISGALTAQTVRVSTGQTGGQLNILPGATVSATQLYAGESASMSGTITQTGGNANIIGQMRTGHFGTETSNYNMNGGNLTLTGDSPLNTPSTAGAGGANANGDNNLNTLAANAIVGGGIYIGVDGTGILNHTAGTITTNWIVLDNRGNSAAGANMPDGIDRYNLSGSGLLKLRSEWGLIARNVTTDVSLGGGTIQLDNSGTGGPAGNTGADLDVPLDATLNTVAATTTTLDTNGADNSFILTRDVLGTGVLDLQGGGTVELRTATTQALAASVGGSTGILKTGIGTTTQTGNSSSYSGMTTINGGKLQVDGNLGGNITVQTTAILGGNGTTGIVTVQNGGIVAPGASVGTLTAASMNLQAGSRYDVEITAAATNDKLNVTGALTANGTVKVTLSGYVPVAGNSFDIADGTISGSPTFDFSAAVLTAGLVWDTSAFLTSGTISVQTDDPFTAWAAGFGLTGGKAGDDDKDGSSNLLEFATNSDPTTGGSGARAFGKLHPLGGDNVLTLTVAVRKSAVFAAAGSAQKATKDKVVYTVEASKDLANWTTVVVTELNAADSAAVQATLALPTLGADWEWHSFRTQNGVLLNNIDMIRLGVAAQP